MTPKIARTGSAPLPLLPLKMLESLHNLPNNDTKIWHPPKTNFKSPKMGGAWLPTKGLTCAPPPPPPPILWPSHDYISTLAGFILISGSPASKLKL